MAVDAKYGQVSLEKGTVGDDEPVVVFRAQDKLLPKVLDIYRFLCEVAGSSPHHLELISRSATRVREWQAENTTKTPSSDELADKEQS